MKKYNHPYSPWGAIQHTKRLADGIDFVGTAGHGGIMLSEERVAQLPDCMRNFNSPFHDGGAYCWEEDCEWGFVALAFPDAFPAEYLEIAKQQAKVYAEKPSHEYYKIAKHFVG